MAANTEGECAEEANSALQIKSCACVCVGGAGINRLHVRECPHQHLCDETNRCTLHLKCVCAGYALPCLNTRR